MKVAAFDRVTCGVEIGCIVRKGFLRHPGQPRTPHFTCRSTQEMEGTGRQATSLYNRERHCGTSIVAPEHGCEDRSIFGNYMVDSTRDVLNEQLTAGGETPVAFDSDCREGICSMCSLVINGQAHGPLCITTACQLTMRHSTDGQQIVVEP